MAENNRKKILHILPRLSVGGIEKGVVDVSVKLQKEQNYHFDFFVEEEVDSFLTQKAVQSGANIFAIGRFKNLPRFFWRLARHLKKEGPYDVVHSHCFLFSGVVVFFSFLFGVPYRISQVHSAARSKKNDLFSVFYCFLLKFFMRLFSSRMLAVSDAAAQVVYEGEGRLRKRKLIIQPMGVNVGRFVAAAVNEGLSTDVGGADVDEPTMVHLGRFSEEKNHKFMIDLFAEAHKQGVVKRLVFVGDGALLDAIKADVDERGLAHAVYFLGNRADVPQILSSFSSGVFIFPSLFEGFGLAAFEAQLAGLPVLASNNVPEAALLHPQLFERLSLDGPMQDWINKIDHLLRQEAVTPEERLSLAHKHPASLDMTAAMWARIYN